MDYVKTLCASSDGLVRRYGSDKNAEGKAAKAMLPEKSKGRTKWHDPRENKMKRKNFVHKYFIIRKELSQ